MRCKKCLKTFRTPPLEMRKTQVCSICTKKTDSKEIKPITPSGKWIIPELDKSDEENMLENKSNELEDLLKLQNENQKIDQIRWEFDQMDWKIKKLIEEQQIIEKQIEFEKEQKHEKNDYSKKALSNENKYVNSMPKKKDSLIEEAEKIKAELEEIKKRKGSICKGICKENKVKKVRGTGRYESGQVHCQTCDVWLDYRGCHKKNGEPAEEDSRGIRCNCCNFQVRAKPRGKKSKEARILKQSSPVMDFDLDKSHSIDEWLSFFESFESDANTVNDFISPIINESLEKKSIKSKSLEIESKHDSEIGRIVTKMVEEHARWRNNTNKNLKRELIFAYQQNKSLKKLYEMYPNYTMEKIRKHTVTDLRLPPTLKELENEGGLHSNPTCSITIALFTTDYFDWDEKRKNEEKILNLAKSISTYLQTNAQLNQLFSGKKFS